jgi:GNAT superfamily N-acetyltransferase/predicted transcriptional regulator
MNLLIHPRDRLRYFDGTKCPYKHPLPDRLFAMPNDNDAQIEGRLGTQVKPVLPNTPEFESVLKLWRQNSQTLGHLPKGAFKDQAEVRQLLGLFLEENLIGYLLYRISRSSLSRATVVHLCLAKSYRGKGLAKHLLDELKQRCHTVIGIGLNCRNDFGADHVWKGAGFVPRSEKLGKSHDGKPLTYWWFDNNHPGLFDYAVNNSTRIQAVLDSNIIYDFVDPNRNGSDASTSLRADWVVDLADFVVTDELHVEISRSNDAKQQEKNRNCAARFTRVMSEAKSFEQILQRICTDLALDTDENTISDAKHLAHAISGGYRYFITRDSELIGLSPQIPDEFDLQILSPLDFIVRLDVIEREEAYRPYKLGGSQIVTRLIGNQDMASLFDVFANKQKRELKTHFNQRLATLLSHPDRVVSKIYQTETGDPLLLLLYEEIQTRLELHEVRLSRHRLAGTVLRHVLSRLVLMAAESPALKFLTVTTNLCNETPELLNALKDCQFVRTHEGTWVKLVQRFVGSLEAVRSNLDQLARTADHLMKPVQDIASAVMQSWAGDSPDGRLMAEHLLWPSKVIDPSANTFIIPIKPDWAKELFNEHRASETLFGVSDRLLLSWENVYYRSHRNSGGLSKVGDRILWYESTGTLKIQEIVGCSVVEEVLVSDVETLFRQFKHLGVYRRRDLEGIVRNKGSEKLMAIRFSRTELFQHPIRFQDFNILLTKFEGKVSQIQSPTRIQAATFEHLYKLGFNMTGE